MENSKTPAVEKKNAITNFIHHQLNDDFFLGEGKYIKKRNIRN
jgi:hypothetical protein